MKKLFPSKARTGSCHPPKKPFYNTSVTLPSNSTMLFRQLAKRGLLRRQMLPTEVYMYETSIAVIPGGRDGHMTKAFYKYDDPLEVIVQAAKSFQWLSDQDIEWLTNLTQKDIIVSEDGDRFVSEERYKGEKDRFMFKGVSLKEGYFLGHRICRDEHKVSSGVFIHPDQSSYDRSLGAVMTCDTYYVSEKEMLSGPTLSDIIPRREDRGYW